MLVGPETAIGTIGGGRLEWDAISRARELALNPAQPAETTIDVPLGPAIGQCCGGHVTLRLERADAAVLARIEAEERAASASLPRVLLFGAGHVGKAIATALAPLPFDIQWIDERAEEFRPRCPAPTSIRHHQRSAGDRRRSPTRLLLPDPDSPARAGFPNHRSRPPPRRLRLCRPDRLRHQAPPLRAHLHRPWRRPTSAGPVDLPDRLRFTPRQTPRRDRRSGRGGIAHHRCQSIERG